MNVSAVLQLLGALMVLSGFTLSQVHILSQHSYPYLLLNVVGSALLALLAAQGQQWGFLLLEGGWALVALWGLVNRMRGRAPGPARETQDSL